MAVSKLNAEQRVERKARLIAMYTAGATLEQCGQVFGITRERARQILKKAGVKRTDGGLAVKADQKKRAYSDGVIRRRDMHTQKLWGATHKECLSLNEGRRLREKGSPAASYLSQMHNATKRGIGWEISFPEWMRVWRESGHFAERGRTANSYVMARRGDNGPYAVWNVHIITLAENGREYQNVTRIIRGTKNKQPVKKANKTGFRGVYADHKRFLATIAGDHKTKYLGCFKTAEEAARAYDVAAIERFGSGAVLNFPIQALAA